MRSEISMRGFTQHHDILFGVVALMDFMLQCAAVFRSVLQWQRYFFLCVFALREFSRDVSLRAIITLSSARIICVARVCAYIPIHLLATSYHAVH